MRESAVSRQYIMTLQNVLNISSFSLQKYIFKYKSLRAIIFPLQLKNQNQKSNNEKKKKEAKPGIDFVK